MSDPLYVAMSGASEILYAQSVKANNLANATTPGFRSELETQHAIEVFGEGQLPTKVYTATACSGYNFNSGALNHTGRLLDIAINGPGWLAVQYADQPEGYSRRGDLSVNNEGLLVNGAGQLVLNEGSGTISVPPANSVRINDEGVISITPLGADSSVSIAIDKIKLVNPDTTGLCRREDGLFANMDGSVAAVDANVTVKAGVLESSNVNAIGELVDLIGLARQYELNIQMMRKADEMEQASTSITSI